jgi:hypothetical protein
MATGHMLTNTGKQYLMQGKWETGSGTTIQAKLLQGTQNTAADTAAEVAYNALFTGLIGGGTLECTATNYVAKTVSRVNATLDGANDRSNLDAADIVWTALGGATNNTLIGVAIVDGTALLSVDWFATPITTNGGDITYGITDLYRAA